MPIVWKLAAKQRGPAAKDELLLVKEYIMQYISIILTDFRGGLNNMCGGMFVAREEVASKEDAQQFAPRTIPRSRSAPWVGRALPFVRSGRMSNRLRDGLTAILHFDRSPRFPA